MRIVTTVIVLSAIAPAAQAACPWSGDRIAFFRCLQDAVATLESEVADLTSRNADHEATVAALEARVATLEAVAPPTLEVWGYEAGLPLFAAVALPHSGLGAPPAAYALPDAECAAVLLQIDTTFQTDRYEETSTVRVFGSDPAARVTADAYLRLTDSYDPDSGGVYDEPAGLTETVLVPTDYGATLWFDRSSPGAGVSSTSVTQVGCQR